LSNFIGSQPYETFVKLLSHSLFRKLKHITMVINILLSNLLFNGLAYKKADLFY